VSCVWYGGWIKKLVFRCLQDAVKSRHELWMRGEEQHLANDDTARMICLELPPRALTISRLPPASSLRNQNFADSNIALSLQKMSLTDPPGPAGNVASR
jgi:hypothetical protein